MGLTQTLLRSKALAALTSPHGVDRYVELVNPMWAAHDVRAQVVDVRRETTGTAGTAVATLTLQPTGTWRGHRSGQYVQVGVEVRGARRATRCFSISSAESGPGERFAITVRAHENGVVSKFLVHEARPGQVLHLSQAEGAFTLDESPATPTPSRLLMISGGSGITPVMSHVRTLLRDGYDGHANRRVTFVHYARTPEDQIFGTELAELAAADNGVDVHLRYTRAGGASFTVEDLATLVPDFREVDTWACGPAGLVEKLTEAYAGSDRLRVEFFKTPAFAKRGDGPCDPEGEVGFTRSGRTSANTGATLLEQAEGLGLNPAFGCRMGICLTCTTRKSEGTVRNVISGAESSLPDEDIQLCVSQPVGDCAVEL